MAKKIGEDTQVTLDLKTIAIIGAMLVTVIGMWFALQSDIKEAKALPLPVIDRTEYELKDELVRATVMDTQDDVKEIKKQLEKIDQRLYELQMQMR